MLVFWLSQCTAVLIYFRSTYWTSLYWQYLVLYIYGQIFIVNHGCETGCTDCKMTTRNKYNFSEVGKAYNAIFGIQIIRRDFFVIVLISFLFRKAKDVKKSEAPILDNQLLPQYFNFQLVLIKNFSNLGENTIVQDFDLWGRL